MLRYTLFAIGATYFFSCSPPNTDTRSNSGGDSLGTGAPVETKAANTSYKPAFTGQTRVASVKTTTPYEFKVLTSSLQKP